MPQGSSAVRPTNGLYLYLYFVLSVESLDVLVFTVLRKNSDYFYTILSDQFYSRDGVCFLRGTSRVIEYISG